MCPVEKLARVDDLQVEFCLQGLLLCVERWALVSKVPKEGCVGALDGRRAIHFSIQVLPDEDTAVDVLEAPVGHIFAKLCGLQVGWGPERYKRYVSDCSRYRKNLLSGNESVVKVLCAMSVYANRPHKFV